MTGTLKYWKNARNVPGSAPEPGGIVSPPRPAMQMALSWLALFVPAATP